MNSQTVLKNTGIIIALVLHLSLVADGRYLEEEMKTLKEIMTNFQGKLEEFREMHVQKLGVKMDEIITKLDVLDKALRSLHERSLMWDTMAQGIRSWEDKVQNIANRVELMSKRQELLLTGDNYSTTPTHITRRQVIDVMASRVNTIDSRLATAIKRQNDDSALNLRRHDGMTERLIRLEGRASLLQEGQQKLISSLQETPCSQLADYVNMIKAATVAMPLVNKTDITCEERVAEKVLLNLLELLSRSDSDDGSVHDPRRSTRTNPEELFRRIWRKFQNPVAKINRRLETVEQMLMQVNLFCNQSYNVNTKIHTAVARGECGKVTYELQRMTVRTDEQISQLEDKMGRQLTRLGKMLDRASRDGTFGTGLTYPSTCEHVQEKGFVASGTYMIQPTYDDRFEVFCDMDTDGGGWTVIHRRGDYYHKRENFNRDWEGYRQGFGDPRKEFWIGNDRLHELTHREDNVIRIDLEDWENKRAYAEYMIFKVGSEDEKFQLTIGNYSGNASDSFSAHNTKFFSTYDIINDESPACCSCSRNYFGGWWFYSCFEAHLNGPYHASPEDNDYYQGIIWEHWRGDYSLRSAQMMIRPRNLHYKYTGRGGPPPEDP